MFSKAITESNYFGTDEILARDRPANRSVFDGKTVRIALFTVVILTGNWRLQTASLARFWNSETLARRGGDTKCDTRRLTTRRPDGPKRCLPKHYCVELGNSRGFQTTLRHYPERLHRRTSRRVSPPFGPSRIDAPLFLCSPRSSRKGSCRKFCTGCRNQVSVAFSGHG